jgi:hypothetical protein
MPDNIVPEMQLVLDLLGKAQNAAAQATARAEQVRSQAAQSGFRGVAGGMSGVGNQLKRVQTMLANEARTVEATVGILQQVNDDMSPADVVSTLSPAAERIGSAGTRTGTVIHELDRVKAQVAGVLRGGQPGPLVAMVEQIKQNLVRAVGAIAEAKRKTEEAIGKARQTGNF